MKNKITLTHDTISNQEVDNLIEWLKTYPRLTKSTQTVKFEEAWSKWLGCKYSVFVNSGSSANLIMLYALLEKYNLRNKKVVVPTLCWATDLAPVIQLGMEPILVDCNLNNLSVNINHLEDIFISKQPSVMILVSVLGLSPNMDKIVELCNKYDVILLEDNCESQGTEYNGKKLGNFGLMSSFSTYFAHISSTIEGGMVCTNDKDVYDILKQLRSHGWDRDLDAETQNKLREQWSIDDFSALYTFYIPGFNVRSTDLQAFIGLGQLEKVDDMINRRNINFLLFRQKLKDYTWFAKEETNSFTASFCIPIILNNKEEKLRVVRTLLDNNIECRPLISGSMGTQPFYIRKYGECILQNANKVDECGIYIPNHPDLSEDEINLMCDLIIKAIS